MPTPDQVREIRLHADRLAALAGAPALGQRIQNDGKEAARLIWQRAPRRRPTSSCSPRPSPSCSGARRSTAMLGEADPALPSPKLGRWRGILVPPARSRAAPRSNAKLRRIRPRQRQVAAIAAGSCGAGDAHLRELRRVDQGQALDQAVMLRALPRRGPQTHWRSVPVGARPDAYANNDSPSTAPTRSEALAPSDAGEPGRLSGDTIPDRRWRIVPDAGRYTLQCEALVPGGWMNVHREPTIPALRRFAAWCGLTIGPVEVAAELQELIAENRVPLRM
jgi:hypothetical protein